MATADNAMLWSAWVLTCFDEALRWDEKPQIRGPLANALLGDVIHYDVGAKGKVRVAIDNHIYARVLIKDGELNCGFETLNKRYIAPAIENLVKLYREYAGDHTHVIFGKLSHTPAGLGAICFRADFNNMSIRCIMQYDSEKSGMQVTFDALFGAFTPDGLKAYSPTEVANGARKPDDPVEIESGHVDSACMYRPRNTSIPGRYYEKDK